MKKEKIIILSMLLSLLLFSATIYAGTISGEDEVRSIDYAKYMENSVAKFAAVGNTDCVYTSLYNQGTSSYHMEVTTKAYHYEDGYVGSDSKSDVVAPGLLIATDEVDREYNSRVHDYCHWGNVYTGPSQYTTVMDYFRYTGMQYYR